MVSLSQETIKQLLASDEPPHKSPDRFYKHGFDKAALFLLELRMDNLFEPWDNREPDGLWWRCKGCKRKVKRLGRQSHYDWHRRELL